MRAALEILSAYAYHRPMLRRLLADLLVSVLALVALALILYGLRLIYPPLVWIGGGVALFQVALGLRRVSR